MHSFIASLSTKAFMLLCPIDEAMIPFKGQLGFKQYIKNKPTKWRFMHYVLRLKLRQH